MPNQFSEWNAPGVGQGITTVNPALALQLVALHPVALQPVSK